MVKIDSLRRLLRKSVNRYVEPLMLYAMLIVLALVYGVPFYWLIISSLKTSTELFTTPVVWFPKQLQWANYTRAIFAFPFFLYLRNTLFIVACNIVGSVFSATLAGYGFSRIKWKGRNWVFIIVLMTMMLPFQVIMIPLFMVFQRLRWIGTFAPLTVTPFLGNAFFIFLMRQFFLTIPDALSEAAFIDGAGEMRIFSQICLPLVRPAVTTVAIFAFLNSWNDFLGPLLFMTRDRLYTLSIGVQQIMHANDPRWNLLMAIGVLMTLPVLIIFFLLQKYFIQGISFEGIKG
ncbi:MAG: carbohydrate ABC transporter permease [Treponema sp.]|jgi:ABC-type glycerol-3-phosphate transport system permease component|nr:carbohydrate ABC transporter permease [Treponema sp.]